MMQTTSPAAEGAEVPAPPKRYEEDERGYLYDATFREAMTRLAKVDRETLPWSEAVRALVMAGKYLGQLLEESMDEVGLSYPQFKTLMCVTRYGVGGTQMHAIAGYLGVTPRNVTGLVDGLEGAGLVERVADPADRRATIVRVTPEGENLAQRGRKVHESVLKKVVGILSEEEVLQLRHLSLKFLRAVEDAAADRAATDGRKTNG